MNNRRKSREGRYTTERIRLTKLAVSLKTLVRKEDRGGLYELIEGLREIIKELV
jgi:hypothetical protein